MGLMTAIAAGATAAKTYGSYMQGVAQSDAERAQARIADYNASVAEQDARVIEAKTRFDQLRQLQRGRQIMGTLRARLGASGAMVDEGAGYEIQADQAFELALENALIGRTGQTQASRVRSQATGYRLNAAYSRMRAKNAGRAGLLNAGADLLGGVSSMNQQGMFT